MTHKGRMAHVTPVAIGSDDGDDRRERDLAFWAKTILIWFIQVVGVSCAIIFGMFSTLAWQNSETANRQADSAIILRMVALCMQLNDKDEGYHALCQTITVAARDRLQALAVSMFGAVPEPTATSTFGPSSTWPTYVVYPTNNTFNNSYLLGCGWPIDNPRSWQCRW
ncbi:hypothetical protein V8F33_012480 [Rhypophila sp. PSN 637]